MELFRGRVRLVIRKRFFTRDWSGTGRGSPRVVITVLSCQSSGIVLTMLSNIDFELCDSVWN